MKTPEEFRKYIDDRQKEEAEEKHKKAVSLLDTASENVFKNLDKMVNPFFPISKNEILEECGDIHLFAEVVSANKFFYTEDNNMMYIFWDKEAWDQYTN